jgi:SAM-dependent methyltransferase
MKRKQNAIRDADVPYDAFAWFYNKYWATEVASDFFKATESLLLAHIQSGAHLLDVCCGTGQVAAMLTARGYRVTGLDLSREMLRYAGRNASAATLLHADAISFQIKEKADGAVALFDSFNHLLTVQKLQSAFASIHAALTPGARFVFDLNTQAGYAHHLRDHYTIVKRDGVLALNGEYDSAARFARFNGTVFRLHGKEWRRSDFEIEERCHQSRDVEKLLRQTGFRDVRVFDAVRDVGLPEHKGRVFYVAQKGAD